MRSDAAWRFDPLLMGLGGTINVIRCSGTCELHITKKNKSENLGGISWVLGFLVTNVVVINKILVQSY